MSSYLFFCNYVLGMTLQPMLRFNDHVNIHFSVVFCFSVQTFLSFTSTFHIQYHIHTMSDSSKKEENELDSSLTELLSQLNSEIDGTSKAPSNPLASASSSTPKAHYTLSSFPTEMSCSQAFDQLVACYSLGGQMRHIYRYGGISYCEGRFAKLRFCLTMKGIWDEEEKAKRIARFYMQRLAEKKKELGSSEDVWKVRTVPVKDPFKADLYALRDEDNKSVDQQTIQ